MVSVQALARRHENKGGQGANLGAAAAHAKVLRPLAMFVARGWEGNEGLPWACETSRPSTDWAGRGIKCVATVAHKAARNIPRTRKTQEETTQQQGEGGRRVAPWTCLLALKLETGTRTQVAVSSGGDV